MAMNESKEDLEYKLYYDITISRIETMIRLAKVDMKKMVNINYNKYASDMYNLYNVVNSNKLPQIVNKDYINNELKSADLDTTKQILSNIELNSNSFFIKIDKNMFKNINQDSIAVFYEALLDILTSLRNNFNDNKEMFIKVSKILEI